MTADQSWNCVLAMQTTGFNTGTPVTDARRVLDRLSGDLELPRDEREYYADLRRALNDLPDAATLGSALDEVECPL